MARWLLGARDWLSDFYWLVYRTDSSPGDAAPRVLERNTVLFREHQARHGVVENDAAGAGGQCRDCRCLARRWRKLEGVTLVARRPGLRRRTSLGRTNCRATSAT